MKGRARAVVIGAGFGGLAAAIRLAARGYAVTVCERLDAPGGRAYVFRQDGFTFDAGPTIVTAPFLFEELWAKAGARFAEDVELRPLDPFYRLCFADGSTLDCTGDPARMAAEIARLSPGDVVGFERFMTESEAIFRKGFEELADRPFDRLRAMLAIVPDLVRLGAFRSVDGLAGRYLRDPRIRIAASFHPLFIGGDPLRTTAVYALVAHLERRFGVHFAMGGTGRLITGMVRLLERLGGELRTNAPVVAILHRDRRARGVELATGETLEAEIVVSNADSATTYRELLPGLERRRWTDRKLARARSSMSLFLWYFGTRRRYPDVPHHTILLGPRYEGLLADIFVHKKLAADFSLYLHRPTATDPALAPPGMDAFYVLSPVPNLEAAVDWTREAEPYRAKIARFLEDTLLPGLEANLVTSRIFTPLDFRDRLGAYRGAAFGLEPLFTQSAWFRPHNRSEELDRLYLVGAGTHPGAGIPGVLSSAKVLDRIVPDAAALA